MENNHDVYTGKYCMKMFCESLREQKMKKIDLKKETSKFEWTPDDIKIEKSLFWDLPFLKK